MPKILRFARRSIALATFFALMCQFSLGLIPIAKADSSLITQIVFTTSEQTINAGAISGVLTVQTQNASDAEEQVTETTTLNLSSSSGTGEFSSSDTSWVPVTELTMNSGTANRSFYYRDATAGTHTLTITADGKAWTAATQDINILEVADPANLYVDDDCIGSEIGTLSNPFCTIQDALTAIVAGGVINVAAGTYNEVGQIVIDKNVTITGEGKATTIVKPDHDTNTASYTETTGWIYVKTGVSFALNKVTLDGSGRTIHTAIQSRGNSVIEDCTIQNIKSSKYVGFGVQFLAGDTNEVTNCEFSNIERVSVHVRGHIEPTNPTATISGCTFVGKGVGDWLDYGVEFGGGGKGTVDDSSFSGNVGVASSDGSTSAGVLATDYYGTGTVVAVTNSYFTNNYAGIHVGYVTTSHTEDLTELTATNNVFDGNTDYGILDVGTTAGTTAANNYWGAITGPAACSDGDQVYGPVDYSPWYTDDTLTTTRDHNTSNGFDCIQDAVDGATDGDTVNVYSGTYNESVNITKGVRLLGAVDRDVTTNEIIARNSTIGEYVKIDANNVEVNGFVILPSSVLGEVAGVYVQSGNDLLVIDNEIDGSSAAGFPRCVVLATGGDFTGSQINDNEIHDCVTGIYTNTHTGVVDIQGNEIYNTVAGIGGLTAANVSNNTFYDNAEAIGADASATGSGYTIIYNDFSDNPVNAYGGVALVAEYNYWGSSAEPIGQVAGDVDYDPWLSSGPDSVVTKYENDTVAADTPILNPVDGIASIELDTAGDISIVEYDGVPVDDPADSGFSFAGSYYDINSDLANGTFVATIVFEYTESPAGYVNGVAEEDLRVTYFDTSSGTWVMIPGVLDTTANTYTFTTDHFTAFTLVGTNMDVTATDNFAATAAQSGTADLGILELVFDNATGSADTLTDLVVTSKNTADSDVSQVELFTGSVGGTSVGTATFSGGTASFSGLSVNIPDSAQTSVFVAYDLNVGLTQDNVLDALIATGDITLTNSGTNIAALDPAGETLVDDIAPTIDSFTDDDTDYTYQGDVYDGLVKAGETVLFTATFNEVMTDAPRIAITSTPCSDVDEAMVDSGDGKTWTYSWSVPTCSDSSDPTISITLSGTDIAGNAYAGTDELEFIYDNTPPTLTTIEGTDAGPVQSDTIQIELYDWIGLDSSEYGFSSDSTCDSGDTYSTSFDSLIDFYILGDHTDYLCARASDDAGHTAYLLVGQLNTDNTAPEIDSGTLDNSNDFLDIGFNEAVWGDGNAAVDLADLRLVFSSGSATGASIDSISTTGGGALSGGETTIRANLSITGTPDGSESVEILPTDGSSIFDTAGNAMLDTETTGAINLNDKKSPELISVDWDDQDGDTAISAGDNFVFTFSESIDTATITGGSIDTDLGLSANTFGTNPTLAWSSSDTVLTVTSYTNATIADGDTVDPAPSVTDTVGNADDTPAPISIIDDLGPVLTEVTPITSPTNDNTPEYTFHVSEDGTITVGGSCDTAETTALTGNNDLTFSDGGSALPDGDYSDCTVTVTDAFGNASSPLDVTDFTIDTDLPELSSVSIASDNADPTLAKVGDTVTISFTADEEIQTVDVEIDGNSADSVTNTSGNTWTATRTMQAGDTDGVIPFTIDFYDLAGNAGTQVTATTDSSEVTFDEIDPTLTDVSIASDNADPTLAKVGDTVTVSFTVYEEAQNVSVTIDGNAADAVNTADNLNFTATRVMQTGDDEAIVDFTIDFDDLAGNSGIQATATTDLSEVTFDETAPTATTFYPTDNSTGVAVDSNLEITFLEEMQAGTGDILIKKSADDSTVATISAADTAQVSFATNVVTIDPTADLPDSTSLYIEIDTDALTDLAGNEFAGISSKSEWNFLTVFGTNGGNIITLASGWNVFSTPRQLSSIEFENGGTDISFYKLEGGTYDSTTTAATVSNVKPLEGFLVNNSSGSSVDVYLDYEDDVTSGQNVKLFTKDLEAGWNIVGVADQSFEANDTDYTEVAVDSAFDSILNQFANIIDYTDNFSDDNDNAVDSSYQINSTETSGKDFEEFKAYPVFIRSGGATYGGSQQDVDSQQDS